MLIIKIDDQFNSSFSLELRCKFDNHIGAQFIELKDVSKIYMKILLSVQDSPQSKSIFSLFLEIPCELFCFM